MSFVPYEHVLAHDSPVYVGESTKSIGPRVPLKGQISDVNMLVLGKRKISTSISSCTPSSKKDLERVKGLSTTSPSRLLKRSAGPSTFIASSSDAFTGPKAVIRSSPCLTWREVTATANKSPEHLTSPRSSDPAPDSSLFVGVTFSHAAGGGRPFPSSPPDTEPSLQDTTIPSTLKGYVEATRSKSEDSAEMRSPTNGLLQSHDLGLSSKTDRNISELLSYPFVNVSIGRERKLYPLHSKLLCHYAEFFRSKFQTTEPTPSLSEVVLPDIKVEIFDSVVNWLYRGTLEHIPAGIHGLYLIYFLTEKLGIPTLGNVVMDAIRKFYRDKPIPNYPGIGRIQQVYQETAAGSPLRRFVVEAAYWKLMKDGSAVGDYIRGPDINGDFVRELIKAIQEKARDGADGVDPRCCAVCIFHVHEDGKWCGASPPEEMS
ncbi:MAG: hypothetical protein M1830_007196 [Pleopsidium flavum]|nr:MAG: hypothetical protein M1830_007196 [Pleopsidium flavum]